MLPPAPRREALCRRSSRWRQRPRLSRAERRVVPRDCPTAWCVANGRTCGSCGSRMQVRRPGQGRRLEDVGRKKQEMGVGQHKARCLDCYIRLPKHLTRQCSSAASALRSSFFSFFGPRGLCDAPRVSVAVGRPQAPINLKQVEIYGPAPTHDGCSSSTGTSTLN